MALDKFTSYCGCLDCLLFESSNKETLSKIRLFNFFIWHPYLYRVGLLDFLKGSSNNHIYMITWKFLSKPWYSRVWPAHFDRNLRRIQQLITSWEAITESIPINLPLTWVHSSVLELTGWDWSNNMYFMYLHVQIQKAKRRRRRGRTKYLKLFDLLIQRRIIILIFTAKFGPEIK